MLCLLDCSHINNIPTINAKCIFQGKFQQDATSDLMIIDSDGKVQNIKKLKYPAEIPKKVEAKWKIMWNVRDVSFQYLGLIILSAKYKVHRPDKCLIKYFTVLSGNLVVVLKMKNRGVFYVKIMVRKVFQWKLLLTHWVW